MLLAETHVLEEIASAAWLFWAGLVCLPVCLAVFWQIGRWWVTAEPVPLPLDKALPAARWPPWFGLLLAVAVQLLTVGVAQAYDAAARARLLPWEPLPVPDMFSPGIFLAQALPPLVGLAVIRRFGRGAAATVGVRAGVWTTGLLHGVVGFAAILPVCLAALIANVLVMELIQAPVSPHPLLEIVQKHPPGWMLPAAILQAGILAPLAEEFLYRGLLLTTLLRPLGTVGALVASAAIFAAVHLPAQPQAMLPLFFLGLALGYLAYRTRSLLAPVVAHALFNTLMILGTFGSAG